MALFRRYHAIGKLHEFKCLCFHAQITAPQQAGIERLFIHALRRTCIDGIIAEGIETQQELSVMRSLGIYLIQGYLFGKPCAWHDMGMEESPPRTQRQLKNAA